METRALTCLKPHGVLLSLNPLDWRAGKLGSLVDLAVDYGNAACQT